MILSLIHDRLLKDPVLYRPSMGKLDYYESMFAMDSVMPLNLHFVVLPPSPGSYVSSELLP